MSVAPLSTSPLTARLAYLADLQKAEDDYTEAWWAQPRLTHRVFGRETPLRGSFSSDEVPNLDDTSEPPSPSSSAPATPAEYVQEYFEQTKRNREHYNLAWSTAVEKGILCVHAPHDSATKLNFKARASTQLAAQLDTFADVEESRGGYYDAWSNPIGETIQVHEPRDSAIKIASRSTNLNLLAAQLEWNSEQRAREDAYDEAWINAVNDGSLSTSQSRPSAIKMASQTSSSSLLAAQLQAASDQELSEQAYADAWSRYNEITGYARAIDAWKAHHLEILRREAEYYDAWFDEAAKSGRKGQVRRKVAKSEIKPFASQLAMFQDMHLRDEEYNEAWAFFGQRHEAMAPAPLRIPRRRVRHPQSRSPRPAAGRRLSNDMVQPEIPMLGFSALETLPDDDEYIKSWAEKMKTTVVTPANSLLLSPPTSRRFVPTSPKPKKRGNKGHFEWPGDITEEERVGLTARGNLQPYLSSLLGKIVSLEFVGQSELSTSPDEASPSTPMQLIRRANLVCQSNLVCKVKASVSITSPHTARRYAQDPLPLFDALRQLGHAAVIQLDQVGVAPLDAATGRQAIWRKYSIVSGAFRCEVRETFVDRRIFSKEGCDFGKKVLIKDGILMSPDGVDYLSLPL